MKPTVFKVRKWVFLVCLFLVFVCFLTMSLLLTWLKAPVDWINKKWLVVMSLCCRLVNKNKTILSKLSFFLTAYLHHYCAATNTTAAFIATQSMKTLVYWAGLYLQAIAFVSFYRWNTVFIFDRISRRREPVRANWARTFVAPMWAGKDGFVCVLFYVIPLSVWKHPNAALQTGMWFWRHRSSEPKHKWHRRFSLRWTSSVHLLASYSSGQTDRGGNNVCRC